MTYRELQTLHPKTRKEIKNKAEAIQAKAIEEGTIPFYKTVKVHSKYKGEGVIELPIKVCHNCIKETETNKKIFS